MSAIYRWHTVEVNDIIQCYNIITFMLCISKIKWLQQQWKNGCTEFKKCIICINSISSEINGFINEPKTFAQWMKILKIKKHIGFYQMYRWVFTNRRNFGTHQDLIWMTFINHNAFRYCTVSWMRSTSLIYRVLLIQRKPDMIYLI